MHRSSSEAHCCSSAAGGCCRARKWFKGPVRMGTEEELERLEAEQEKGFAVPADTSYRS